MNFPVQLNTRGEAVSAERTGAGSTHLRYATPWQARWHVTAPSTFAKATADKPLRFGTGLATPEQSGGGRLERA